MTNELDDFARDLEIDREIFLDLVLDGVKQIAEDTTAKLVKRTPVDTGLLKSSWVVSLGEAPPKTQRRRKRKHGKRGTVLFTSDGAEINAMKTLAALDALEDPFADVFITNPMNYASFVDTGETMPRGRNTRKKPDTEDAGDGGVKAYNMVQLTIAEMHQRAYVIGDNE